MCTNISFPFPLYALASPGLSAERNCHVWLVESLFLRWFTHPNNAPVYHLWLQQSQRRWIEMYQLLLAVAQESRIVENLDCKLRLENPPIREGSCICSVHSSEDCFECYLKAKLMPGTKARRRLKPDAVAAIFSFKPQSDPHPTSIRWALVKEQREVS